MAEGWVTVRDGGRLTGRSHHTIYNWILRTRRGVQSPPLRLRRSKKGEGKGWLICSKSLMEVEARAPKRVFRSSSVDYPSGTKAEEVEEVKEVKAVRRKEGVGRNYFSIGDTMEKVIRDRRRWVRGWVEQGRSVKKVLEVFAPELHSEIEGYYDEYVEELW